MIEEIRIKSFKSLRDVSLELGSVNVFVGANGSGKSNLLEAIGVLGAAASGRVDDEGLLRRGVRPGVPALYKTSLAHHKMRSAIGLVAQSAQSEYAVELINPTQQPQPAWSFKSERLRSQEQRVVGRSHSSKAYPSLNPNAGLAALETARLSETDPAVTLLATLRDFAIYTPNTPSLRGIIVDPQTREPVGLHGGRLAEAVSQLRMMARQSEAFEEIEEDILGLIDWAASFGARRSGDVPLAATIPTAQRVIYFRDRYMAEGRNELSGYDASEGALYVLFCAVLATLPGAPPMFAIDNIDAGLNPLLARRLMERLCQWILTRPAPRQLLLTCHNPLVLDGLPLLDDRIRLFVVDRASNGETVVRRVVVDEGLLARAHEGWSLSRLWTSGHLGGVPHV